MSPESSIGNKKLLLVVLATLFAGQPVSCEELAMSAEMPATPPQKFSERTWTDLQRKGSEALDANRYWLAEPLLKQAITEGEKYGCDNWRLAKSLSELGRMYTIRRRWPEAETLFERELHVREMSVGSESGKIIQSMGSLVRFYLAYGTKSKAEPLTEDILCFVEGKMREPRTEAAKTAQGAPLVGWCGTAAPVALDPMLEWAITCDGLGHDYRMLGNYKMSERLFRAALDLKMSILGSKHLSLANSYDNLGTLMLTKGDYAEGENFFRESLTITEQILGVDSVEVYPRLHKLALCLIKEKKYDEADKVYRRALDLWKKEPSKNGDESRCLYALGSMYVEQGRYAAAAPVLRQALNYAQRYNGPLQVALVPYLQRYGYCLYYLGRRGEASAYKARADFILGPQPKPEKKTDEVGDKSADENKDKTVKDKPAVGTKKFKKSKFGKRRSSSHRRRRR